MYNKWQRAAQRTNKTGKEFELAYLQFIQSNLLEFNKVRIFVETKLIHSMRQGFKSEIRIEMYRNPTVPKDGPKFLEDVACEESSIHLEHKTISYAAKCLNHNNKK